MDKKKYAWAYKEAKEIEQPEFAEYMKFIKDYRHNSYTQLMKEIKKGADLTGHQIKHIPADLKPGWQSDWDLEKVDEYLSNLRKEEYAKKGQREAPERKVDLPEKKQSKKTCFKNDRFINKLEAGIYNMAVQKSISNPTLLLLYLLQYQPYEGYKDKHKTWDYWHCEKSLIVASVGVEKMAKDLEVSQRTIINWSNALHKDGIIIKHSLGLGKDTIYILGEIIGQDKLYLYSGGTNIKKIKRLTGE